MAVSKLHHWTLSGFGGDCREKSLFLKIKLRLSEDAENKTKKEIFWTKDWLLNKSSESFK